MNLYGWENLFLKCLELPLPAGLETFKFLAVDKSFLLVIPLREKQKQKKPLTLSH